MEVAITHEWNEVHRIILTIVNLYSAINSEGWDNEPSMNSPLTCSALLKSPRIPFSAEYFLPPSPAAESGDELSPVFDHFMRIHTPEEYLQPALHSQPPYILSPTSLTSSVASSLQTPTSDPLHLIIGDESEEAAQGYTISCLADDFLQRGRTGIPSFKEHQQQYLVTSPSENVECNSAADVGYQLDPLTRCSADLCKVLNSCPSSAVPATENCDPAPPPCQVLGHRRSSSHGNPSPFLPRSIATHSVKDSAFSASSFGELMAT